MENEITRVEPVSPLATAAQLVQQADGKLDVGQLRELLELQERYDATEARKAYTVAMAAFKANPPTIIKDKQVSYGQTSYKHATLSNATSTINKALSEHGLTAAWVTEQDNGNIKVTCRITHIDGHAESTSMTAPPDNSGKKNPIQQIASTVTYLSRYTLFAITGLAPQDEDDDGAGSHDETPAIPEPNEAEQKVINAICEKFPAPDGMRADPKKVANLCLAVNGAYPSNMKRVDKAIEWLTETGRPVCVPDVRDDLDKALGLPGDEDSKQDEPRELRYYCNDCSSEYDNQKKEGQCPVCLKMDVIDRQAK